MIVSEHYRFEQPRNYEKNPDGYESMIPSFPRSITRETMSSVDYIVDCRSLYLHFASLQVYRTIRITMCLIDTCACFVGKLVYQDDSSN